MRIVKHNNTHTRTEEKLLLVKRRIKFVFPKTPEGKLMFSVVMACIEDAFLPKTYERNAREISRAQRYIKGNMYHAEIAGVDSEWIRRVLNEEGLTLESEAAA